MSRTFFLPLSAALALAASSVANAAIASVNYLIPVRYDMVITRASTSSESTAGGVTTEKTAFSFEVFTDKDLLKLILGVTTDAEIKGWSLYAVSDSETFTNAAGIESLQLVARKKSDADPIRDLPEGQSFALELNEARAYSSSTLYEGDEEDPVLSNRESILQLATLTQALPARGARSAGTLTTTGLISHGIILNKVTIGGETTDAPITRPTAATYRAAGTFNAENDAEDGLAEVLISFGAPTLEAVEAPEAD